MRNWLVGAKHGPLGMKTMHLCGKPEEKEASADVLHDQIPTQESFT